MPKFFHKFLAIGIAVGGIGAAFLIGAILVLPKVSTPTPLALVSVAPNSIAAKAAVIYDPTTGRVLYQKDANDPLPLASLTKLMTADVVLSEEEPQTLVTITDNDLMQSDAGDIGFAAGQTASVGSLVQFGLIASSNDAMAAAAQSLGPDYLDYLNNAAEQMGLTQMRFLNPTGLDQSTTVAGAYGSAYDVARLAADFYHSYPNYFENTATATGTLSFLDGDLSSAATAAPLLSIPGFIAAKTGYTDLAGGNLVALFDLEPGHPLVAAVLGSTEDGRYTDIETLISDARSQLSP